jgi:L-rhamnose isomerase/sugar isomerase
VPRDPYEKIEDAAAVHRFTGVAPSVALHIPWDKVDDWGRLSAHAADHGVSLGTINSNVFQDPDYAMAASPTPSPGFDAKPPTTCWSASTLWTPPDRGT